MGERDVLAEVLHSEYWDDRLAHSPDGCGDMEEGSVDHLVAALAARGYSLQATPQPEAGLDAAWAAVEALRAENERLREFLALRPSGHTGSMTERIPWFIHCGISHGENRPDCLVCAALREPKP